MREKLIELIRQGNGGYDFNSIELIADHLIANGVTIPVRCKDCEYGMYAGLGKFMCELHDFVGKAYFYCADGERRTDDE